VIQEIFQLYSMDRECGKSHPLDLLEKFLSVQGIQVMTVNPGFSFSLRTPPRKQSPDLNRGWWCWGKFFYVKIIATTVSYKRICAQTQLKR